MTTQVLKFSLLLIFPIWLFQGSMNLPIEKPARPAVHTIVIEGMKFKPAKLEVKKGDIVIFVNKDFVAHDATEVNKKWASPKLEPNDVWKTTIEKSAKYYCSIHEVMKGEIVVKN